MDSNTYRFSTRDGVKYLTCNGFEIKHTVPVDWGWHGNNTWWTAWKVLQTECGVKTANQYSTRLAREYLAEITADEFVWTSGVIAFMINQMEKNA